MKRVRSRFAGALLLALLLTAGALGEDWGADREIHCADHRPGCRLLQMVMMGSFDGADADADAVSRRVLASAWPRLCEVSEADLTHFAAEFGEDEALVRGRWYGAMAACLRADILSEVRPDAARRVLLLFLDPGADDGDERAQIRRELDAEALSRLAEAVGAPVDFVRWLTAER